MPGSDDLIGAAAEYSKAQSDVLQSKITLLKSEARLGLLQLAAAVLAALAGLLLLATAWALINVALAQWVASFAAVPGIGFLIVAVLNAVVALILYRVARKNLAMLGNSQLLRGLQP